jgi:hypothetical protein
VDLSVYDSQGRHTGPNPDGTVDEDIPGSSYEKLGENSFVVVPAGGGYRVVDRGLSSGNFTMKVKGYRSEGVDNQATYVSIPLESASTTAELQFSGFNDLMTLKLDNTGDGIVDSYIEPTAILSGTSASDVVPPKISMPSIAETNLLGSPITFTFSAFDDLSGISKVSGTIDDVAVENGVTLSNLSAGSHTFAVQAIDRAGNPRIETKIFKVIYNFGGFQPPIKPDGSGVYNLGRTLPVKFNLSDANGNVVTSATAYFQATSVDSGLVGTTPVILGTSNNDSGNYFRVSNDQYIYNLNTGILGTGTWKLTVSLDDGMTYSITISLRN